METGELELRKAFEEVATKNIKAMLSHGNETRRLTKELDTKVIKLEETIRNQNILIDALKLQLSVLQAKVFSGGT